MRQTKHQLSNDPVLLRIMELLKAKQITEKEMLASLGYSSSTFTKWKYNNVRTYRDHINEIADYLEVSSEYLTQGVDDFVNMDTISSSELQLLKYYRKMGNEERNCLLETARYFYNSTSYRMT